MKKTLLACALTAVAFSILGMDESSLAKDLDYPKRDIRVIVPFNAGGNADLSMKALVAAANHGKFFKGVNMYVENIGGGGAVIGQTAGYRAKPDGYTLMLYTSSLINNALFNNTSYKYDSFLPIAGYNPDPEVLYVPANSLCNTLKDFYDYCKKAEYVVGVTPGHTTGHHLRMMNIAEDNGFNFQYIHFNSASEQLLQVVGNHADFSMNTWGATKNAYKDGKVKILAIATKERMADCPEIPTFVEQGVNLVDGANRGICIREGVDPEIYQYLIDEFKKVIETDLFVRQMHQINAIPAYQTPEEYKKYMDDTYSTVKSMTEKLSKEVEK